jgi:hypothetical protein
VPNVPTIELWPLSFGQRIACDDLLALQKDSGSWLSETCRRSQACVMVAPSADALLNRADYPSETQAAASVAIRRSSAIRFEFEVTNGALDSRLIHLFLQSGGECIYWGAYQPVSADDDSYVFLANRMTEVASLPEVLAWEALDTFVDLPLDAPDTTLIAYFTDDKDAATIEHRRWQNHLASWLRTDGLEPRDYRSNRFYVDIAWELTNRQRYVCEVKTATSANERTQIYLGMGQSQSYALEFGARPVLFLGTKPTTFERVKSPATHGVFVLWPEALDDLRPHDLDGAEPAVLLKQLL